MYHLRRVFAFLAAVGLFLAFGDLAHAQSVVLPVNGISFTRLNRGNLKNDQINYADCHEDGQIKLSVTLTNFTGLNLQIWAGAGCDQLANRGALGTTICNQLGTTQPALSLNPDPIFVSIKELLKLRTYASGTSSGTAGTSGSGTGGEAGNGTAGASTASGGAAPVDIDDPQCTDTTGNTAPQTISMYIMLTDAGNNVMGTFVTAAFKYKLLAPAPPVNVKPGIGETLVALTFDTDTSDTTINGYNFYCDPPPGVAAAADAGVLPVDGGDIPACSGSSKLIAGHHADSSLLCGSTGARSTRGNATGLVNGVAYNVAVATTDSYYNNGVLSKVVCQVPQPVTGFFEAYRDAGGEGGGGFCSFSRRREPLPFIVLLGFTAYWVMRRRRAT